MTPRIDRRCFLKTTGALLVLRSELLRRVAGAGIVLAGTTALRLGAAEVAQGAPNAEKLGWRLGVQAWSFNKFTFYEAVEKTASLGLHYIEAFPGQKLTNEEPKVGINENLSPDGRNEVKKRLADKGIKLVNYGVCGLSKDADRSRKVFDFAKDVGIETICSEPGEDAFDCLDKLCEEYGINVAIHNHPQPSHYWNPDTVLKVCQGRSKRIGDCADTGHWMRSGINPIEALKKLEGRIISFHFKDLDKLGAGAHDVPWGTGVGDVKGMLTEIHRQGIKAVFSIEYEYNWVNSLPDMAQCVAYFDKIAAELGTQGK